MSSRNSFHNLSHKSLLNSWANRNFTKAPHVRVGRAPARWRPLARVWAGGAGQKQLRRSQTETPRKGFKVFNHILFILTLSPLSSGKEEKKHSGWREQDKSGAPFTFPVGGGGSSAVVTSLRPERVLNTWRIRKKLWMAVKALAAASRSLNYSKWPRHVLNADNYLWKGSSLSLHHYFLAFWC